jgi:hypothetical protein
VLPESARLLLADVCRLLELRGLKPYDAGPMVRAQARWDKAALPAAAWSFPVAYRYHTVTSIGAGWGQLLRLDVTALDPSVWRPELAAAIYDPGERLARFRLDALDALAWHPYIEPGE